MHQPTKVIETKQFPHIMALTLNPAKQYREGIIRCIIDRQGSVDTKGFKDQSLLYKVKGDASLKSFVITEPLHIDYERLIADQFGKPHWEFLGLEDPDIWQDPETGLLHLYFTIAFHDNIHDQFLVNLGHAQGQDLDSLDMTLPVLWSDEHCPGGAKEASIAPINKQGFRYNLVESLNYHDGTINSVARIAIAKDMGGPWEHDRLAFNPLDHKIAWISEHASPGPLFEPNFIDVGQGKQLGIMNGRSADQEIGRDLKYGMFAVGLFIYDYEQGKIDWVSPEPLIADSQAKTVTFASQFVQTKKDQGLLYAHIDDSYVNAYDISASDLKKLLP